MEKPTLEIINNVPYAVMPDGRKIKYADILAYNNPGMQYDDVTLDVIVATPATAEDASRPARPEPDVFGDTTMEMAAPYFKEAAAAWNAPAEPTYFTDPVMGSLEQFGQGLGNVGVAGLNAAMGGLYGGLGLLSELVPQSREREKQLAYDLAGMFESAGPAPEGRMLGALADAGAGRAAAADVIDRLNQRGPIPTTYSNPIPGVLPADDFGKGWSDVYHWSRSPEGFAEFDPNASTSAMSQLGPHVGTKQAAEARYMGWADANKTPPPLGFTLPLKADLQKPFMNPSTGEPWSEMDLEMFISAVADEQGVDRRSIAPFMRQKLAEQGYTSIPYLNDVEDAGSLSHIMLTEARPGDAVLRSRFAKMDPANRRSRNLSAAVAAGLPFGLLAMQPDQEQY